MKYDTTTLVRVMAISTVLFLLMFSSCRSNSGFENTSVSTISADAAILDVKSYGFVDLEGAKVSAIVVRYDRPVEASSVSAEDYEITDFAIVLEEQNGFDKTIELDGDGIEGNEGQITNVYVNDEAAVSADGGTGSGNYVIIEVNTAYMLSGQNLSYTTTMMAGVKQIGDVSGSNTTITAGENEIANYSKEEVFNEWRNSMETVYTADKDKIILPEFGEDSGWTINRVGDGAFEAVHCYSEYSGEYEDFDLPYSIYVPDVEVLRNNMGDISLVIHMEHAGANDTDPMAAVTSSKAAVRLSGEDVQSRNPAIVIVPQIEESRRSANDLVASSEANTAIWQLLDSVLKEYEGYIDTNRIYGTGQSMGGMTILNMASQRDNFFAGIAVIGAQWSNSYDKDFQNSGSPARSPENDPVSFNGFGLDEENYQNWYYMISDDNILVHTCSGDPMASGLWSAVSDYYEAAGVSVPYAEWDPYLDLELQNENDRILTAHDNTAPGSGINWGAFSRGSHMSTWKYGYQLDYPFEWLFAQNRQTEISRGKIEQLKNEWLGRDADGEIIEGSGTANLNSEQFTPHGASEIYTEGWTPVSATNKLISLLPSAADVTEDNRENIETARTAYEQLADSEKKTNLRLWQTYGSGKSPSFSWLLIIQVIHEKKNGSPDLSDCRFFA